ncbi:unnamed protein product [Miscanthus lutarioriparius]|uniref:Uncharacterized protein n=1 Tax=Miscanthus lutarioriparius TaxID=422564 RepID=A0A811MDA6_9POAL|nr:unnamed protein product [Miscanthus lutarioriparius]
MVALDVARSPAEDEAAGQGDGAGRRPRRRRYLMKWWSRALCLRAAISRRRRTTNTMVSPNDCIDYMLFSDHSYCIVHACNATPSVAVW